MGGMSALKDREYYSCSIDSDGNEGFDLIGQPTGQLHVNINIKMVKPIPNN